MIEGPIQTNNSGLVFYFDTKEPKSFIGKPTTNLLSNPTNEVIGTTSEFVQYADLAPIFNTYGTSVTYSLSLDLKAKKAGSVYVYMQNGSWTKYSFVGQSVNADTVYKRFTFNGLTAAISTPTETQAILAFYGGYGSGIIASIKNVQVEISPAATPFVDGSRSNTQGLLDLTGNYTIDLTNAAYDNSSKIYLSGSKAIKINSNSSLFSNAFTWSAWHYIIADGGAGYAGIFWAEGAVAGGSGYQYLLSYRNLGSNAYAHYRINNATTGWGNTDTGTLTSSMLNKWIYTTWTFNNGTTKIYINGVLSHTDTSRGAYNGGSDSPIYIGARNDLWGSINGYIDLVSYHNRTLTDAEILKNFNSQRSRYSV